MQKGFTVIELLIVIVIVGILAAVAIVSYSTYQKRAYDVSVQSDLQSIAGELEAYRIRIDATSPNDEFPRTVTALETLEIQATKQNYDTSIPYNMIYCIQSTGVNAWQQFKVIAQSKSGKIFMMTQDGFQSHALTTASLTSNACTGLGMSLVSNGMSGVNTWQNWVRTS